MRISRVPRALVRALVVLAVVAVPAFAAENVINTVLGGRFVTLDGKRVDSMKVFFTNGVIQKTVVTERRATKLVVRADGGVKCGAEWPHITVTIDDVQVDVRVRRRAATRRWRRPLSLAAGTHVLKVGFDNDYYEPANAFTSTPKLPLTCDRNLLLGVGPAARGHGGTPRRPPPPPAAHASAADQPASGARAGGPVRHPVDRRRGAGRGTTRSRASAGPATTSGSATAARTARGSARSRARSRRASGRTGSRCVTATTPTASAASWRTATRARAVCTSGSCSTAARRCGSPSRPTCRRTSRSRGTATRCRSRATAGS